MVEVKSMRRKVRFILARSFISSASSPSSCDVGGSKSVEAALLSRCSPTLSIELADEARWEVERSPSPPWPFINERGRDRGMTASDSADRFAWC